MSNQENIEIEIEQEKPKVKILVVDDEKINLKLVETILGKNNYDMTFAISGEECLEKVGKGDFSLVLMDIHMPGLDGFTTCEKLHQHRPQLPVIIMTASSGEESIKEAFESGAVDYVRKPFNRVTLIARVKSAIQNYDNRMELSKLYLKVMNELDLASKMQSYIIPEQVVFNKNLLLSSVYEPSIKVSGDIFDIIDISDNEYIFYIGDISGHGIKSALLMTAVRASIRMIVEVNKDDLQPHDIVNKLNKSMCDTFFKDNYMTLLLGKIDFKTQTFEYCNAGHPPIIEHKLNTGETILLDDSGDLPVGWMKSYEYEETETNNIRFDSDSILFFYTDGIIECENSKGEDLDVSGLLKIINKFASVDNVAILPHALYEDLEKRGYHLRGDDVTFVSLKYRDEFMEQSTPKYFYYKLNPQLSEVANFARKCDKEIKEYGGDEMVAAKVELALVEILNNIVLHGLDDKTKHNLKITVEMILDNDVHIKIWDCGTFWMPDLRKSEDDIEKMDERNRNFDASGRGTDILKEIVDEFSVRSYKGMNETKLKFEM